MPKKSSIISVNLMQKKEFSFSDKFIQWILTYGRYIIIGTEIVVLLAFLSRFKLDREYIDLHDQIKEKQNVLTTLKPIESNVNQLQARLAAMQKAEATQGRGILGLPSIAA